MTLFSCSSDFALYFEDYLMDSCDTWDIGSVIDIITNVGRLDLYFMV